MLFGAIEAGGTKCICAVADEEGVIQEQFSLPTASPEITLDQILVFFKKHPIEAIGIGMFGPVNIDASSPDYGQVLASPKKDWQQVNVYQYFKDRIQVPIYINTDVNMAAIGEYYYGAARDAESCVYMTVGTGIGAGFILNGKCLNGTSYHPEMGHMFIKPHPKDFFRGSCSYHEQCLEGLAAGPSLFQRYGKKGAELAENKAVWNLEAYYLAQAVSNFLLLFSPEKIILGGGVMKQTQLYGLIHSEVEKMLNGYLPLDNIKELIVPPLLGDQQAIKGAVWSASNNVW
ncbi:ROK family protein [Alkalicoccus daliensis]|uniref:fructokinase n=1 Tax=Alkalicoccus daliensis TaxID=745820 RepID=A0A1H0HA14_9BACI|nr:ROK family protein [Alkalicoccus daliensis]SDO15987.1 fructokinase [Alkalicoccus daliensis]